MTRDRILTAVVLRVRPGDTAREAFFLSREEGLVRAAVFGGPKSKLRAYISPFNSGTLYLYHDPVRNTNKATDFDCRAWRPGLRERYERVMAADELAKTALDGLGGDFEAALCAAEECLDALEQAEGPLIDKLIVHFRWRWAGILGIRPELAAARDEAPFRYLPPLGEGAAKWLLATAALSPHDIGRFTMDIESRMEARRFCDALIGMAGQ